MLTNQRQHPVYISKIVLRLAAHKEYSQQGDAGEIIKLEPFEPKPRSLLLLVDGDEKPVSSGEYELQVHPSVGRMKTARGTFPMG